MNNFKTETIKVPYFEGFECAGFKKPTRGMFFISEDGTKLHKVWEDDMPVQICYRKIEPIYKTLIYIPKGIGKAGDYTELCDGSLAKITCPGEEYTYLWRPA